MSRITLNEKNEPLVPLPIDELSYLADLVQHEIDTIEANQPDAYYGPEDLDLLKCALRHLDDGRIAHAREA